MVVFQIRLSLYILSILGPTLSHFLRSNELFRATKSSIGVTELALFLTTIVYTARRSIDLFHATCVFHLLGLAGISISPKGHYPLGAVRTAIFSTGYNIVGIGYLVWLIYVFATAPNFGEHPECNHQTIYVIFGANVGATVTAFRWVVVAGFAGVLLPTCIWAFYSTFTCCRLSRKLQKAREQKLRRLPPSLLGHWAGSTYIVVMLELMIRRNSLAPGIGLWTFGQVLAMAMLIGPVIELVGAIVGKLDKDESDRNGSSDIEMT